VLCLLQKSLLVPLDVQVNAGWSTVLSKYCG
jgi:hypothetical protein